MPFDYCMFSLISYRSGGLFEHGGFIIMCVVFLVVLVFWVVWPVIILCPGRFKPTWGKNTRTYTIKRNNSCCKSF